MYIDNNGKTTNEETPLSCATCNQHKSAYYVKANDSGFLYDPFGLFSYDGDLVRRDTFKDRKVYDWFQTNQDVYETYVHFLKTKSRAALTKAQNLLNSSNKVNQKQVFKRSGK